MLRIVDVTYSVCNADGTPVNVPLVMAVISL